MFLLNSSLSVQAGAAGSHQAFGWQTFTDAVVAALAGLFVVLIQPVFTFPEWVPAVLVEPQDIAAAFWNVWQDTATVMELRTPEVLRSRFFSRLMGWACGFGALALGCVSLASAETTGKSVLLLVPSTEGS